MTSWLYDNLNTIENSKLRYLVFIGINSWLPYMGKHSQGHVLSGKHCKSFTVAFFGLIFPINKAMIHWKRFRLSEKSWKFSPDDICHIQYISSWCIIDITLGLFCPLHSHTALSHCALHFQLFISSAQNSMFDINWHKSQPHLLQGIQKTTPMADCPEVSKISTNSVC